VLAVILAIAVIIGLVWVLGSPTPAPTPTPTPTESPTPTPTTPPVSGSCTTDTSTAELGEAEGAAGSTIVPIVFTNTSTEACTLEGFPTVEFVGDGNGTQIGATATEDDTTTPALVTVEPGASAVSTLTITDAANADDCEPTDVDGFRIIPPGSGDAFFIEITDYQACANTSVEILKVTAITAN